MPITQNLLKVLKDDKIITYTLLKIYADRWNSKVSTCERRLRECRDGVHKNYDNHVGVEMKDGAIIAYKWVKAKHRS